jgi:hypothetical protein
LLAIISYIHFEIIVIDVECYLNGFLAGASIPVFDTKLEQALHPSKELDTSLSRQGFYVNSRAPEKLFVSNLDTSGDSILKVLWVGTYSF